MTGFYRLHWDSRIGSRGVRLARVMSQPRDRLAWRAGERFPTDPPQPIQCTVDLADGKSLPAAFLAERVPLFSDELVTVLTQTGVDNLQLFPAQLLDGTGKPVSQAYHATNIIGKIEAADMDASDIDERSAPPMAEFRTLVIDPSRAGGAQLFRLAENPSYIVISEHVARSVNAADLLNVVAVPLIAGEEVT